MKMRRWLWVPVFALVACGSQSTETETVPPATAPPAGSAAEADRALIAKVCAAGTCTGDHARIEIWRDAQGAIGRLVYDGDIDRCSHPPRSYYDKAGNETLAIPFEPVEPGSPKALEYERTQNEQLVGLTKDRELSCGRL
jgi:hypothetical protein